jgi:hypothetical protein
MITGPQNLFHWIRLKQNVCLSTKNIATNQKVIEISALDYSKVAIDGLIKFVRGKRITS